MQNDLTNKNSVLNDIKQITQKRDYLQSLCLQTTYSECCFLFVNTDKNIGTNKIYLTQENLPFNLEQEIKLLMLDAIEQYDRDIASLNEHLKTL
jgi:hypothetical protein